MVDPECVQATLEIELQCLDVELQIKFSEHVDLLNAIDKLQKQRSQINRLLKSYGGDK